MNHFVFDTYRVLRFATRLPLPVTDREKQDPIVSAEGFAPAFAASGIVIALLGGAIGALAAALGASPALVSVLTVAALILLTGALHEDGLADCADGIGGGRTRERKLEIMRDSHIGTYGVLALIVSVALRLVCLASLFAISPWMGWSALFVSQPLSRAFAMVGASQLDHARKDGVAAALGRPSRKAAMLAVLVGALPALCALGFVSSLTGGILYLGGALAACLVATTVIKVGARRFLGGQTGDVLGAIQQVCDLAVLIMLSISLGSAV